MNLEQLLRHAARRRLEVTGPTAPRTRGFEAGSGAVALGLAGRTLRAMARSGMYDQLAGGFARYAVDAGWVVPHFEKMLYDNAQLARVYLHWWRLTRRAHGGPGRAARRATGWSRRCGTAQGGFAASLDADTPVRDADGQVHGVEGYTYVWTPAQLLDVARRRRTRAWAGGLLRVTPQGTFEHGSSTLQLDRDVWLDPAEGQRWEQVRGTLLAARGAAPAAGPRRQGGRRLERPRDRGPRRDRRAARAARPGRGGRAGGGPAARRPPRGRPCGPGGTGRGCGCAG